MSGCKYGCQDGVFYIGAYRGGRWNPVSCAVPCQCAFTALAARVDVLDKFIEKMTGVPMKLTASGGAAGGGVMDYAELLEAIRTVNRLHDLGDAIYTVRERAATGDEGAAQPDTNSWDLPSVVAYSDAVGVIRKHLGGPTP